MERAFHEALDAGLAALGLGARVDAAARARLERYADRLLAWNRKVNLTAVTDPAEVAEKHLVDSLALLPVLWPGADAPVADAPGAEAARDAAPSAAAPASAPAVAGPRTLLDVGAGAGLPGIPLACARPSLQVTCCDSVGKKVAFVKAVAVDLGLDVRGVAARAEGDPERERLPRADVVVSRALADPERWVPLGQAYVLPGGVLVAMLGRGADRAALEALGRAHGLALEQMVSFRLPRSGSERAVATWRKPL